MATEREVNTPESPLSTLKGVWVLAGCCRTLFFEMLMIFLTHKAPGH